MTPALALLLAGAINARHAKDLVVPECKNGPTHTANHLRLDYWVLRRSWVRPAMIGYEVKSSRADWLKDDKWPGYLPLCNELWFIAATPDAVRADELPQDVGLLRLAGSRLITVRRAVYREIEPPVDLLTYVLMCRTRIDREGRDDATPNVDRWRAWLAEREDRREVGWQVAKKLREKYERDVVAVQRENRELRERSEHATRLRAELEAAGIEWRSWLSADDVARQVKVRPWDRSRVEDAHKVLGKLLGKEESE